MKELIFEFDTKTKSYFILETTDEKLFVIAQLLLDVHALDIFMKFIHNQEKKAFVGRFHFHKIKSNYFGIDLFNDHQNLQENDTVLTIEIERANIDYLLKSWFELSKNTPRYITITRTQDVYDIN